MSAPLRTEADVRRRARTFDVDPELLCMACGRVSPTGLREHFGHRISRLSMLLRHAPATEPVPRARIAVLTVQQIAAELEVSKMSVYRLIHSGELPCLRIGRSMRVREADFLAWLNGTELVIVPDEVTA